MRHRSPLILLAATAALAAAGCGGDDGGATAPTAAAPPTATAERPVATAPAATAPPADALEAAPRPASPRGGATAPAPSGASSDVPADAQEPVRVPARFTVRAGALDPPTVTVPPFLAVALSVASGDGAPHRLVVATPTPRRLAVPADGRPATARLAGLRAGRYPLLLDGRRAGALVVGGEVGP